MTPLEQFNEEVMNEFRDKFSHHPQGCDCIPLRQFITQKLTEQKELILKIIKEKSYARLKNFDALDWDRFEDILDEIK